MPDGELGATLRSLCDLLGISRVAQAQRIHRNPLLVEAVQEAIISNPGGQQQAEILLNWAIAIWAAGLHISRLSETRQAAVQLLQRSAFATIQKAFTTPEDNMPTSQISYSVVNQIRQEFSS